jgi:DNA-binding YbaB/EbfC family protein
MAGVGTLLKQAQKMQKQMESLQSELEKRELDLTSGGGAIAIKVNGGGKFLAIKFDPEFLKEDPKLIEEALLLAVQEAAAKAKELNESEMKKVTSAFQMPGFM